MTTFKDALDEFWSQFGVPAYLSDNVPTTATLPYITYNVTLPDFNGSAVLTAFNWHERVFSGNRDRMELMDKIAEQIPIGGRFLPVGDGYITMYRNVDFQTDWQDENDTDVLAGRTSYIVQYYNAK